VLRTLVPIEREVQAGDRWFFARLQPYRTSEDQIAGIVLTFVDITERNRATEALRQSEERYRLVINSAMEYSIFTFDPERRITSWNEGARRVFGYTEPEIMGQLTDMLFTPEDREKGDPAREAILADKEGHAENERWHARKDGSIFYGSGAVMPLRDASGTLRGFVKIMRDLTESKRTQEALREHIDELTRFNNAAVGRETRMIELKEEVNNLCARLEEEPRYVVQSEDPTENR
jgi:two-component system, chemotaxis family, CheB/CheR fusion protein